MRPGTAAQAAVALATALLLAGCATAPLTAVPLAWEARASRVSALPAWQARGRVAVATTRDGFSGSFEWRERADRSDINVRGPIGIGGVSITREDREVRIATSKGEVFMSQAPDQDLEARLGAPLPISYLRYWMTGQPAPLPAPQPAPGSVGFEQAGWTISYERFDLTNRWLPGRITATRDTARIRVVVDRWEFLAP